MTLYALEITLENGEAYIDQVEAKITEENAREVFEEIYCDKDANYESRPVSYRIINTSIKVDLGLDIPSPNFPLSLIITNDNEDLTEYLLEPIRKQLQYDHIQAGIRTSYNYH